MKMVEDDSTLMTELEELREAAKKDPLLMGKLKKLCSRLENNPKIEDFLKTHAQKYRYMGQRYLL